MLKNVMERVGTMAPEYRGAPFWSWNSKLDPDEIRRQIQILKDMGVGGFFMHARVGLNTPYLGGDWFQCVKSSVAEAEKLGMRAWIYDEDRWPSGSAGGYVTKHKEYRMRKLDAEVFHPEDPVPEDSDENKTIAWFLLDLDHEKMTSYQRLRHPKEAKGKNGTLYRIFRVLSSPDPWYNDQTYLDTMNVNAVQEFVKTTHDAYKREVGSQFSRTIPGIFTDEPCYLSRTSKNQLPWTDSLPDAFRKQWEYDLIERLPELFFVSTQSDFSKVRLDFYSIATSLFVNAFSKTIGTWCEQNQVMFTGHVMAEDTLSGQTAWVGAAMRFYEYMQAPGIDLLTEHWNIFMTAKQCTSVAHQFGRKWRLSESYGCTGWDFPFFGQKALGDWQYAMGINLRCQHLSWYSMEGQAKRDYPASIFYQSPWYLYYPKVEEYFARIGAALDDGEEVRDILLLHPIESMWGISACNGVSPETLDQENNQFLNVINQLLRNQFDFDFGDEDILFRHAVVTAIPDPSLRVKEASYGIVIVPPMRTIRSSTLKLLDELHRAGGTVIYIGKKPDCLDGRYSSLIEQTFSELIQANDEETLAKVIPAWAHRVEVRDPQGNKPDSLLFQLRKNGTRQTLFLCNLGVPVSQSVFAAPSVRERNLIHPDLTVTLDTAVPDSYVYELNLQTGDLMLVAEPGPGPVSFKTALSELESKLFFATPECFEAQKVVPHEKLFDSMELGTSGWKYRLDEPNVLVMDQAEFAVEDENFSKLDYILNIDKVLRDRLGARHRGGHMCQPWVKKENALPSKMLDLTLKYQIVCNVLPPTDCELALEHPENFIIELNGKHIVKEDTGYWCDRSIRKILLPARLLKIGTNVLTLKTVYHELLSGLESIFLLGKFGVQNGQIIGLPPTLASGDIVSQGFENYSGNLTYISDFEWNESTDKTIELAIRAWRGVGLTMKINQSPEMHLSWAPFFRDISKWMHYGKNRVEITLLNSRRNSHGPFYLDGIDSPHWCGSGELETFLHPEKILVPVGILNAPVIRS